MLIHEIFEAWASKAPNHIAILFEDQSLTYQVLNNRANQLARYLRTLGVGPESVVGICLERCPDLVAAVLAVLKAGGACLPLDPAYPPERLAYMLKDTRADFVLTQEVFSKTMIATEKARELSVGGESFTGSTKIRTVLLDREWPAIDLEDTDDPRYEVLAGDLALIFYTSGSTGIPKAVMWGHSQGEVPTSWEKETFRVTERDRHLLKASIGFTLLTAEVFLPLRSGGQLIIVPTGLERDVDYLTKLIARQRITRITLVPSMLRALVEHDNFRNCTSLSEICAFGEALPEALQKRLYQYSDAALTVVYGATEAPSATSSRSDRNRPIPSLRLGKPLPGKEIYLLNNQLDPVSAGEQGEIYIGGDCLARGYMGRPDLTAEKFIPHPFAKEAGARLYRTGDLGRSLPDGDIEFVGRADHQLKIRGYRVEPEEIEKVICRHPGVLESVVVGWDSEASGQKLVAYVVPRPQHSVSSGALRVYLRDKLPEFMLPAVFVQLTYMPLTVTGKLDRMALPDPGKSRPELDQPYAAPASPVEEALAKIWAEVLDVDGIGVHDNFFELGGDSLNASRIVSRVIRAFNCELPLRSLFESPTVAQMAIVVGQHLGKQASVEELELLLTELESLTDEEAQKLLQKKWRQ